MAVIAGSRLITSKLDKDVANYKARIIAAGGNISDASLQAHNKFVKTLKTNNEWDKYLEIATFAGTNLSAALVKLKYPPGVQSTLTSFGFVSADYTEATGLTGDISGNKYLKTGFIPSANLVTSLDAHLSVYARNTTAIAGIGSTPPFRYLGSTGTGGNFNLYRNTLNISCNLGSGTEMNFTVTSTSRPGQLIVSNIAANSGYLFYNGGSIGTDTSFTTNGLSERENYIFGYNNLGSLANSSSLICAFYSFGYGLNSTQAANSYSAVQALQTLLGRQV